MTSGSKDSDLLQL